jgi:methyl-accepting chemotaxis protein
VECASVLPGAAVRGFATARYSVLRRFVLEFVPAAFVALHIQLARGMEEIRGGVLVSSAN